MLEFDLKEATKDPFACLGDDQMYLLKQMLHTNEDGSRKYKGLFSLHHLALVKP